ncbi:hypothetical protein [Homoserinimonas aerilata]|nr:hypothetical protein [Homoserinimonas aerilata]
MAEAQGSVRTKALRRIAIIVVVVSLSVTALIGIITLLTGGDFGETQGRIMLTTLVIGVFGVLALCDLAIAGRRYEWAGYVGILASAAALAICLLLIWDDNSSQYPDALWKTLWLATIAATSLAQANLLLLLADRRRTAVRVGLWATLGLIALLAVLIALLVLTDGEIGSDGYARFLGTVAILDVLGTIVVPVIGAILRDGGQEQPARPDGELAVTLPPETAEALTRIAAARGIPSTVLAAEVLGDFAQAHPTDAP